MVAVTPEVSGAECGPKSPRHLRLVESGESLNGTVLLEEYVIARDYVSALPDSDRIQGDRLEEVKLMVGDFLTGSGLLGGEYDTYDPAAVRRRWEGVGEFLREVAPDVDPAEIEASMLLYRMAVQMKSETPTKGEKHPLGDASFAFVVPMRIDRDHPEYSHEVESVAPFLRYIPEHMRADVIKGMPETVIDVYERTEDDKRGYLVWAPVFGDEAIDLAKRAKPWNLAVEVLKDRQIPTPARMKKLGKSMVAEFMDSANERVNNAANLASRRLGADVVGIGAIFPMITRFGQRLDVKNSTTGHGGTVYLIGDTLREVRKQNLGRAATAKKIGVLGLGSIGASIAYVTADDLRNKGEPDKDIKLVIFDKDNRKMQRTLASLKQAGLGDRVEIANGAAELLQESDVVISAITSKIDLSELRLQRTGRMGALIAKSKALSRIFGKRPDLNRLVVIDDGQPGSFTREDAEAHGVILAWVHGRGYNGTGELNRSSLHFGAHIKDVFGCEAEAATIAAAAREARAGGMSESDVDALIKSYAIREPVNPAIVRRTGALFDRYHVGAAPLQSHGILIESAT